MDNDTDKNFNNELKLVFSFSQDLGKDCFLKYDIKDFFKIFELNDSLFDSCLANLDANCTGNESEADRIYETIVDRIRSRSSCKDRYDELKSMLLKLKRLINMDGSGEVQVEMSECCQKNSVGSEDHRIKIPGGISGDLKLCQIVKVGKSNKCCVSLTVSFRDKDAEKDLCENTDLSCHIDNSSTGDENKQVASPSPSHSDSEPVQNNKIDAEPDVSADQTKNSDAVTKPSDRVSDKSEETGTAGAKIISEDESCRSAQNNENCKSENTETDIDNETWIKTENRNDSAQSSEDKVNISEEMNKPEESEAADTVSDEKQSSADTKSSLKDSASSGSDGRPSVSLKKDIQEVPQPNISRPRPNPRTLWKDLPVPSNIAFYKESTDCACLPHADGLKIFGASRRGRSHAHVGNPRDDDFKIARTENEEWYILIVADGAGSAKYSREGARIACDSLSRELNKKLSLSDDAFNNELKKIISDKQKLEIADLKDIKVLSYRQLVPLVKKALSDIEKVAENSTSGEPAELKDFSTTLLFVITRKFGDSYLVVSFSIGDGAIVVYDEKEKNPERRIVRDGKPYTCNTLLMNTPDSGEFAGQTRFLTMKNLFTAPDLINRLSVHFVKDFTSIMLMTDGVSDAKFETEDCMTNKENWDLFWKDLTEKGGDDSPPIDLKDPPEKQKTELLEWLNYWAIGNHDDRTLVVMYRNE